MRPSRFARSTEEKINEQIRKERAEAETRARAAAWEAEKAEAQGRKVRRATPGSDACMALAMLGRLQGVVVVGPG